MAIAVKVPKHLRVKPIRSKVRQKPKPVVVEDYSLEVEPVRMTITTAKPQPVVTVGEYQGTSRDPKVKARNKKIAEAYVSGLTLEQCVAKFKVSLGSVRHALKNYGVESRSRGYRS